MYCSTCGAELSDNAQFCGKCGASINADSTAVPSSAVPAQSGIDDTMREVPSEKNPSTDSLADNPDTKGKSRNKLIAVIILLAIILIGALVGYKFWNDEQQRLADERQATVIALVGELTEEASGIIPNTGETADRAILLEEYVTLEDAKDAIVEAEQSGDLELADGSVYDVSAELADIDSKIAQIHDWFAASYQAQLDGSSFAADADASSMSAADCQAKIDALTALLALVDSEKVVWGGQTGEGSTYAALVSSIDAQIAKGNELLPAITAREEEERKRAEEEAKANGFLGSWRSATGTPGSFTITFNANGTGAETVQGIGVISFTWWKENLPSGAVTIYVTPSNSNYDPTAFVYDNKAETLRDPGGYTYIRL